MSHFDRHITVKTSSVLAAVVLAFLVLASLFPVSAKAFNEGGRTPPIVKDDPGGIGGGTGWPATQCTSCWVNVTRSGGKPPTARGLRATKTFYNKLGWRAVGKPVPGSESNTWWQEFHHEVLP